MDEMVCQCLLTLMARANSPTVLCHLSIWFNGMYICVYVCDVREILYIEKNVCI